MRRRSPTGNSPLPSLIPILRTWTPPDAHVVRSSLAISRPATPAASPLLPSHPGAPCPWIAAKKESCRPQFPNSHHRPRIWSQGYRGSGSAKTTHAGPSSVPVLFVREPAALLEGATSSRRFVHPSPRHGSVQGKCRIPKL
jgi:hypothetical protein